MSAFYYTQFSITILITIFITTNEITAQVPTCDIPSSELEKSLGYIKQNYEEDITGRFAVYEKGDRWTGAKVYFTLDQNLKNDQIALVYQSFAEFHKKTCIRFKPWNATLQNYITIRNSDTGECSLSEVCMKGGQQFVQLGGLCWFREMVIHQLGHTLCLAHEHQRPVRDWYLNYRDSCPNSDIPAKLDDNEGQLGFYDYASQMHFACGWCSGGWPKKYNVRGCGYQVTEGLSLLDADYINLLYACGGCHRHRWVPVDKLIPGHTTHMYNFGHKDKRGHPLYPCRVSFEGEVIVGKFTWFQKICSFSLAGKEYYQTGPGTEVLLIPGGLVDETSEYRVESITAQSEEKLLKIAVPGGRLSEKQYYGMGYIAFGNVVSPLGKEYEDTIGKAWERSGRLPQAFFPLGGEEVSSYYFKLLTCHER